MTSVAVAALVPSSPETRDSCARGIVIAMSEGTTPLTAADGYPLAARWYGADARRGVAVIAAAMGVRQDYYSHVAAWLARHGYSTLTFDYRGVGGSRRGPLRELRADVLDWARLDAGAALAEALARAGGAPLIWIGHSLGGQIVPFVPGHERISKVFTVATGSGYWLENTVALRLRVWWLWFFLVPAAHRIYGYFPGRRFGKVGDLPRGVMEQWRRWCLHRDYAVGVEPEARELFAAVESPLVSLSFTDDELMSARNIESIHSFYENAPRTMRRIDPGELGLGRIGHFGFFRAEHAETLWRPELLARMES